MELLSPAGNLEKLRYVYRYGADAAYAGFGGFSLRTKAEAFTPEMADEIRLLKGNKKLYGAFNTFLDHEDIDRLEASTEEIAGLPFDAFILSDLGSLRFFQRTFPQAELHLSTQANCLNAEAAKVYRDLGFSRLILGREASLKDIERIKKAVPDVELEVFVHGAMCLAYSGRCFLSRWELGRHRSANRGGCAHACRWEFRVLEEKSRPGEYFPVEEGDGWSTILSSRDLNLLDHLGRLRDAGVDSCKIEGRMKSLYYAALTTRAYRSALDALDGKPEAISHLDNFREELFRYSHREYSSGFLFDDEEIQKPHLSGYEKETTFCATIGDYAGDGWWHLEVRNPIHPGEVLEFLGPESPVFADDTYVIHDEEGTVPSQADHMKSYTIKSARPLGRDWIVRQPAL